MGPDIFCIWLTGWKKSPMWISALTMQGDKRGVLLCLNDLTTAALTAGRDAAPRKGGSFLPKMAPEYKEALTRWPGRRVCAVSTLA